MIKPKIKILNKFLSLLIKKGKLSKANHLMMNTLFFVKNKTKKNPINLFTNALKVITPGITTRKNVIAGRLYHLPSPITKNKALYFSCKWLQQSAIENKELNNKTLDFKIAEECFKIFKRKGQALVFLSQHNKIISENRPFLRFVRRKFGPRLPRRLWLKKKRILWLSRRKKYRKKRNFIYNFKLNFFGDTNRINYNKKKYFVKRRRKTRRLFQVYKYRILKYAKRNAKIRVLKRKARLEHLKKIILFRHQLVKKNKPRKIKTKKIKNENKSINKKNKFQSRS